MIDREDHQRRIAAEYALQHMKDQRRLIEARGPVVHETMEPVKNRRLLNHFTEEYEELFKGNR